MSGTFTPESTTSKPIPSESTPLPAVPPTLSLGLILVVLIVAFESMAVSTVLPRVAEELQGLALYGWASSAFLLSSLFGAVLGGVLADRRGLAFGAILALILFAVGLLVGAASPTMLIFVLARLIQGLGAGGLAALPWAVISTRYPPQARARMLAAISSAWLLPALVGPLIASLMADTWSWRTVFWGLVPLLLVSAPMCILPLRVRVRQAATGEAARNNRRLLWAALGLAVAAGTLVEGLRRADAMGLLLGAAGLTGLGLSTRTLFPAGMWRFAPGLPSALMVRGFAAFAIMGTTSFLPLALNELRGLTLTGAGIVLSLGGVTWTLGSWIQARMEDRLGEASRPARIRGGMVGVVVGLAFTALGVLGAVPLWAMYPAWVLACLGMGIGYTSTSLFAMSNVKAEGAGQLSGQLANIESLMVALAAGVGGALIARMRPLDGAFTLAFAVTLLGAVVALVVVGRLGAGQKGEVEEAAKIA
ncbi:MFS transporter [Deinococcus arenicola]|uniref:MFS transporter n=1 Tax=Deinococcus arenicola TaxID=2994950 RepID=A0ABU4DMS6_9DEIO|nr:MFS transporter [Deinococcus sp. ZS9-10]MDV6373190.1 MFS transporter [Deinococcus sp. ZS9-10]